MARSIIDGPWFFNWDAGIMKNISIGEKYRIQLRAEAFNVLNNVNFFIPEDSNIFNIRATNFGQIAATNTYAPRIMQFAFRFEF
ncbi:MAG: hypothetical protein R2681_04360 [Pyrinomonadaceae bacterium]